MFDISDIKAVNQRSETMFSELSATTGQARSMAAQVQNVAVGLRAATSSAPLMQPIAGSGRTAFQRIGAAAKAAIAGTPTAKLSPTAKAPGMTVANYSQIAANATAGTPLQTGVGMSKTMLVGLVAIAIGAWWLLRR